MVLFKQLVHTSVAKNTLFLYTGNVITAFLGFLFTLVLARALSLDEFGLFSVILNLNYLLLAVSDFGISAGLLRFLSDQEVKSSNNKEKEEINNAFFLKAVIFLFVFIFTSFLYFLFPNLIIKDNPNGYLFLVLIYFSSFFPSIIPFVLQGKGKFLLSAVGDVFYNLLRLLMLILLCYFQKATFNNIALTIIISGVVYGFLSLVLVITPFYKSKVDFGGVKRFMKYSSWIGLGRILGAFSSRIDLQLILIFLGTSLAGVYSLPQKLMMFVNMLVTSFAVVLATRYAGFVDNKNLKKLLFKSTLATLPLTVGIIVWIYLSPQFIVLLFGEKYIDSVIVLRLLLISSIPFIFSSIANTTIIYGLKRTKFMTVVSLLQLIVVVGGDLLLISYLGVIAPAIILIINNTIVCLVTWIYLFLSLK